MRMHFAAAICIGLAEAPFDECQHRARVTQQLYSYQKCHTKSTGMRVVHESPVSPSVVPGHGAYHSLSQSCVTGGTGANIGVLAKIESAASVQNLDSILDAVDGAMVARGDLGAELAVEEVSLAPRCPFTVSFSFLFPFVCPSLCPTPRTNKTRTREAKAVAPPRPVLRPILRPPLPPPCTPLLVHSHAVEIRLTSSLPTSNQVTSKELQGGSQSVLPTCHCTVCSDGTMLQSESPTLLCRCRSGSRASCRGVGDGGSRSSWQPTCWSP